MDLLRKYTRHTQQNVKIINIRLKVLHVVCYVYKNHSFNSFILFFLLFSFERYAIKEGPFPVVAQEDGNDVFYVMYSIELNE